MMTAWTTGTRRDVLRGGALAALTLGPRAAWSQDASTRVLANGRIARLDPLRPEVEAMALRGGLFLATGDLASVRAAAPGRRRSTSAAGASCRG